MSKETEDKAMIDERVKASYERWPMATPSDAGSSHGYFMEFGLGFERGWKASHNKAIDDAIGVVKAAYFLENTPKYEKDYNKIILKLQQLKK